MIFLKLIIAGFNYSSLKAGKLKDEKVHSYDILTVTKKAIYCISLIDNFEGYH